MSIIRKLKNLYHLVEAIVANIYYGFPSRKLKVIGVTGTDGKTTTTSLIYHILKTAGKKVSMISSVYANVGGEIHETGLHTTTPSAFEVQKYLHMAVKNHDEYFVLETTSHALDQNRVWGVDFAVGVITNITHEHLDYHLTYENYVKTKAKLLLMSKKAVINANDSSFNLLKKTLKTNHKDFVTYTHITPFIKKLKLSDFNEYNFLAGQIVAGLLSTKENKIEEAFKTFKLPPGRLEIVYNKDFQVMIDFAHTPNAIEVLLKNIRKRHAGRIIHVFGSAGLRDYTKRPLMGEASGRYADIVVLTEEDYRSEDPVKICASIAQGLEKNGFKFNKNYFTIIDRRKAIEKALKMAKKGDIVILTGKGHEKSLCRNKTEYPWDDKKAVLQILQ